MREKGVRNAKTPKDNVQKQHTGSLETSASADFYVLRIRHQSIRPIHQAPNLTALEGKIGSQKKDLPLHTYIETRPIQFLDPHQASFFKFQITLFP